MKANLIKLEYTVNLGNYSNIKVGGEWNVEENESVVDAMVKARKELQYVMAAFDREKAKEAEAKQKALQEKINQQLNS